MNPTQHGFGQSLGLNGFAEKIQVMEKGKRVPNIHPPHCLRFAGNSVKKVEQWKYAVPCGDLRRNFDLDKLFWGKASLDLSLDLQANLLQNAKIGFMREGHDDDFTLGEETCVSANRQPTTQPTE